MYDVNVILIYFHTDYCLLIIYLQTSAFLKLRLDEEVQQYCFMNKK